MSTDALLGAKSNLLPDINELGLLGYVEVGVLRERRQPVIVQGLRLRLVRDVEHGRRGGAQRVLRPAGVVRAPLLAAYFHHLFASSGDKQNYELLIGLNQTYLIN